MSLRRGIGLVGIAAIAGGAACGPPPRSSEAAVAVVPVASSPAPAAPVDHAPPPGKSEARALAWERDEHEARARARREGRPLLVYLRAGWSVGSLWMEREVWTEPRVAAEARAFVALLLDLTSAEGDAELYAHRYGATTLPAVSLFDREGRRASLLLGAQRAEELLPAMKAAAE